MHEGQQRWELSPIDLHTDRLWIRQFLEADITPEYLGWLNDRTHMRFSNQRFVDHSPETARDFRAGFDGRTSQFLALESAGQLVGTATVHLAPEHGTADIGILVGIGHGGIGLGREAVGAIADDLLRQGVRKVTVGTSEANLAMQRLLDGLGFEPDGRRPRQEIVDGQEQGLVYFARFAAAASR